MAVWNISKIAPFGLFLMRKDVTCLQPVSSFVLRCFRSDVAMFQIQHNMCPQSIWAHSLSAQSLNLICIDLDLGKSTLYSCVCLKKNSIIAYGKWQKRGTILYYIRHTFCLIECDINWWRKKTDLQTTSLARICKQTQTHKHFYTTMQFITQDRPQSFN